MAMNNHQKGLTSQEVIESRNKHGKNILTPPAKQSLWKRFKEHLNNPLIIILLVAMVLSIFISFYEYLFANGGFNVFFEPLGIFIAILLATVIGFAIEVNANKKFEILNQVNDYVPVKVIRDGEITQVPRCDIVVGDIVILETGDGVPADGVLLDSLSLTINESTLTGEPLIKKSHLVEDFRDDVTYPTNYAMKGTTVIEGHGVMEITVVGDNTEYGKVYEAAQIDTKIKTPLSLQFDRLGKVISWGSYLIGLLIIIGRVLVFDWNEAAGNMLDIINYLLQTIMIAITLIVVSVPEGLPMSVTLSLALSMRRMLASNNLVRKLHACETMGATTVICTDKTGTLTQNKMKIYRTNFFTLGDEQNLGNNIASYIIEEGMAVNTTAFLEYPNKEKNEVSALGNPTEGALLLWLHDRGINYLELRENTTIVQQLPFSTQRKFMATVVDSPLLGKRMLYVKGAPEIVLGMCQNIDKNVTKEQIAEQLLEYQQRAMRTLGFAYAVLDNDATPIDNEQIQSINGLIFIGIVAISDPIREEVPTAIRECIKAGISIKIVTGDTPGTAKEIGRQVGLWSDDDSEEYHISGPNFASLPDDKATQLVKNIKIMSRARPIDKSRLVSLLQQNGEVVAVTGDGTNDAPALNAAQVGLSMGDGTSVAKEASDITIMDNSFASITKAVMWGRSLYQNIQRFILFQLTVNVVACLIVTIGAFTSTESPLTVTQMLWVNLIMDTLAALALASLPPSSETMKRKPRKPTDFIISRHMKWVILGVSILFAFILFGLMQYLRHGGTLLQFNLMDFYTNYFNFNNGKLGSYNLTIFFTFFVFMQFWNLFNARAFESGHTAFHDMRNSKVFFSTLLVILLGHILIVEIGGQMFNVEALNIIDWIVIVSVTSLIMLLPLVLTLVHNNIYKKSQ